MANMLPFKCYLLTNNGQEIRRFALDSDLVGSFTYLQEKVRVIYQLLNESLSISYIDEEGDKVTISSDEEAALMFAEHIDEYPFRLIVQITTATSGTKPESATPSAGTGNCQGEVHCGVKCDGCEGAVKGFRYKCFQCPDYDLCGKCESAGQHPGHILIRVTGPMPAAFQAMKHALNGGPEVPHWRRGGRYQHGHGWNAWCPSGMNVEVDPQTTAAGSNKGASKTEAKPQCPSKFYMDQAKETATTIHAQAKETASNFNNEQDPEYLAGLGSTIASVSAEDKNDTPFAVACRAIQAIAEEMAQAASLDPPQAVAEPIAKVSAEAPSQIAAQAVAQAAEDAYKESLVSQETVAEPSSPPPPSVPASQFFGARPKEPTAEKAILNPDPFISAALDNMLAMGFTNEGGWLAQLLEDKGGNIEEALDVLLPQFQRQKH